VAAFAFPWFGETFDNSAMNAAPDPPHRTSALPPWEITGGKGKPFRT
jgi:hypothetical protein